MYEYTINGVAFKAFWVRGVWVIRHEATGLKTGVRGLGDEPGLGRIKAATKKSLRDLARRIATDESLRAPVVNVRGATGYLFTFSPAVRWAVACQMAGL